MIHCEVIAPEDLWHLIAGRNNVGADLQLILGSITSILIWLVGLTEVTSLCHTKMILWLVGCGGAYLMIFYLRRLKQGISVIWLDKWIPC